MNPFENFWFQTTPAHLALFEAMSTFAEVGKTWQLYISGTDDIVEQLHLTHAAVAATVRLRTLGAPTVAPTVGARPDDNPFKDCQNAAELALAHELATEEPPGDGEASASFVRGWYARLNRQYSARARVLRDAGVM